MPVMRTMWRQVYTAIATARWSVLFAIAFVHMLTSWALMSWLGESDLTDNFGTWWYYYLVTATTVGYGDLSPATEVGRTLGSVFVIPGAIAIFTALLGKAVTDIGNYWKGRLMGMGDYSKRNGHVIVMGWQGERTRRLIEGMIHDDPDGEQPILVSASLEENPMPSQIDFVAVETLSDVRGLTRAGIAGAKVIIVRGRNDDETLAATLAARANACTAHVVAHFEEAASAALVSDTPNLEAVVSVSTDIIVRAACDPGTSTLSRLMFSATTQDTAYSVCVPEGVSGGAFLDLLVKLKRRHGIALIGMKGANENEPDLNCDADRQVNGGDALYYIGDHRLRSEDLDWSALQAEAA